MKYGSFGITLAAFCLGVAFMSCKPIRSEQGKTPSPSRKSSGALNGLTVSDLKIGFVPSSSAGELPESARSSSSDLLKGATRDGQVLQLKKRISMKERLFLVFPNSIGGREIVDASYEHRVFSSSGLTRNNTQREFISFDREQQLYFIPLDKLADKNEGFSSMDLQILELNLRMDDGTAALFEIRFYVKGDLPSVDQIRLSQVLSDRRTLEKVRPEGASVQNLGINEGWTILKERYTNPLSRPLTLWFSAQDVSFQLITQLGVKLDPSQSLAAVVDQASLAVAPHQYSKAPLDQVKLVIRDLSGGKTAKRTLDSDSSVPVRMAPGQSLEVEWRVFASGKVTLCHAGGAVSWKFRLCAGAPNPDADPYYNFRFKPVDVADCAYPPSSGSYYDNPVVLNGTWGMGVYSVAGQFKNHVVLTEEIGAKELELKEAIQSGFARTFPSAPFTEETYPKPNSDLSPLYSCQGIF